MRKITNGEWRVIHEPFCVSVESDEDIIYERYLSDVHDQDAIDELQEALATATLVHAAPDLLRALKELLEEAEGLIAAYHGAYGSTPDDDCVIEDLKGLDYARSAIAKATIIQ